MPKYNQILNYDFLLKRHQAMMKSALEGIHIMDIFGNIVEANDTFCNMLGYTQKEISRMNVADWDAQWTREELMERFNKLIQLNGTLFETYHRRKDGIIIEVEVSTTGAEIDGQYYLFASSRNITERKKFESALRESEERLKLALSGAGEGTWDLDWPTGRINFDSQWGNMLGYTSEKERPQYFEEWSALIHPEDKDRVLKAMHDHVENLASEYKAEYRIRSRLGTSKWIVGHGRAVQRDMNGKALRIVGVTHDISLRKQAEDRIWELAHFDSLTMLPNRSLFYDRLNQSVAMARRHNKKLAILFLDLDGFKKINDQFGHDTGDGLLQEVAERLRQYIRGEDTVARTGGDEFIIILNDISLAENAAIVASKIISSLVEPFVINKNTCTIGGSIGISIFPDDSDEIETLITQSDNAMYQAKAQGKNNYQFFATP